MTNLDLETFLRLQRSPATEHLRCPVCGKVSPVERFDPDVVANHTLERLVRYAVGGREGFRWERDLDLTNENWLALQSCLLRAYRRAQDAAFRAGADVLVDTSE